MPKGGTLHTRAHTTTTTTPAHTTPKQTCPGLCSAEGASLVASAQVLCIAKGCTNALAQADGSVAHWLLPS